MSVLSFIDNSIIKPAISGGTAFLIDKYYFKESNTQRSIYFAAAVGTGIAAGTIIGSAAPDFSLGVIGSGKAIESRIAEITLGTGAAYAINKFVLKNDFSRDQMMKRVGAIVVCDIAGEFASDFFAGRALSIFS
jgi:hypothetical protein